MNMHDGVRPYECHVCNQLFAQAAHLTAHLNSHTGNRPYICPAIECPYRTTQSSHLNVHVPRHTGDLPHKCHIPGCVYQCTTKGAMRDHIRSWHTKEEPYACLEPGCNRTYSSGSSLRAHVKTHTKVYNQICPDTLCGNVYWNATSLAAHVKSHHTDDGQKQKKREEVKIRELLEANDISFKIQHVISFKCLSGSRDKIRCHIDFVVNVPNENNELVGYIYLEIDEKQHKPYGVECEINRMTDAYQSVSESGNTYPIAFLRYNPDAFKANGMTKSVSASIRRNRLINMLKTWEFHQPFSVLYMYYDAIGDRPVIFDNASYSEAFKTACIGNIVD